MFDVAIIGAGVIGGMIASKLSEYRLNICIIEKENDVACGASRANSGIVHAGFDAKEGSLKAEMNVLGAKMMPEVCKRLGVRYINNGSLVVGFNEDDKAVISELYERGVKNGVDGLFIVEGEELFALEPNLSKNAACALYASSAGIVCPYGLTIAAVGNAMDNGASLLTCFEVKSIDQKGEYFVISDGERTVEARYVINAAGLFSDRIARMVGDDSFSITPRRGEYLLLDRECGSTVSHTIFRTPSKMGKGILVSPTADGNLLLGPTSENIEDKNDKSTTPEGFAKVVGLSGETVDGIALSKTITSFCGLRAVGDSGDFIINTPIKRFINVAGIESPGLSSAPAIALKIRDMLIDEGLVLEANPSYIATRPDPHAFRDGSDEEKNRIIKKDPSFGKIVCRCEKISEGEILQALRSNPKPRDLDGVKRRTRAQMGRCQGGFCSPHIAELIAKELEIPFTEVTKSGGESVINYRTTKGGER